MCWFEHGITRSAGRPEPAPALGFLPGSLSVHYDGDPIRRPAYLDAVARGAIPDGYGADDGVGLLFEDTELVRIVASRPGTHAYRVQRQTGDGAPDRARDACSSPSCWPPCASVRSRDVPEDIREFRAERYGAARARRR